MSQGCPIEFAASEPLPAAVLEEYLGGCGEDVVIYRGCRIHPPERVWIGQKTQIDEGVQIFAGEGVQIGRNVHLAFGSSISGGGRCRVGDFASIGAGVRILTGTDIPSSQQLNNPTVPDQFRSFKRTETEVGAFAVVYTNVIVFPGVTIGDGAVVSAGSVVHHNLEGWKIYAGNPLVAIGSRDEASIRDCAENMIDFDRVSE